MKRVFMAAPVRGKDKAELDRNLAMAEQWFWRIENTFPEVAVEASWITACRVFDDAIEEHRARGIARNKCHIERCDELYLCGDRVSAGMQAEANHALECGKPVFRAAQNERGDILLTRYAITLNVGR